MNKGFEAIEAHHLFGVPYERIEVVVHPQSIVHSLVAPQRRRLARPPRLPRHAGADLLRAALPRARRRRRAAARPRRRRASSPSSRPTSRPSPACGWRSRRATAGGTAPCVLNAADEVAVAAFLDGRHPLHRDRRGDRARPGGDARAAGRPLRRPLRRRRRGAARRGRREQVSGSWRRHELGPDLPRVRGADHPPRGGHFIAAKATGMRVERFFLFFPPKLSRQTRRDRVRDRRDPARRLREDHRNEPGRGPGAGAGRGAGGRGA